MMNLLLLSLWVGLAKGLTNQDGSNVSIGGTPLTHNQNGSGGGGGQGDSMDGRITPTNVTGRHDFWRNIDTNLGENRRIFGGQSATLEDFPASAALMDRYWNIRCSGSIISNFWALTAAHCVTSRLTYVLYNAQRPSVAQGNYTTILYLYRHPKFKVKQEDLGQGMDVTLLHHDLGLIRTRDEVKLRTALQDPIASMRRYTLKDLIKKEVTIIGFGVTTEKPLRRSVEELFSVKLVMVPCNVSSWYHCICGIGTNDNIRGVCSGDSGGAVVYQGVQVGVTSMGPIECTVARSAVSAKELTSVFTSLSEYADFINATILEIEGNFKTEKISIPSSLRSCSHRLLQSKSIIFLSIILVFASFVCY